MYIESFRFKKWSFLSINVVSKRTAVVNKDFYIYVNVDVILLRASVLGSKHVKLLEPICADSLSKTVMHTSSDLWPTD